LPAAAALLLAGAGAAEISPAWDLLFRALAAGHDVSYQGMLEARILVGEVKESRSLVRHRAPNLHRIEYLAPPALAGLVVQDEGGFQRILNPAGALVRSAHPWQPGGGAGLRERRLLLLRMNYRPEIVGQDRVAGRPAHVVTLTPKAAGNPWRKLWIDQAAFVVLKNEGYDAAGRLATSSEFSVVELAPPFRGEDFSLPGKPEEPAHGMVHTGPAEAQAERLPFDAVLPAYLPRGYVFEEGHLMEQEGVAALHLAFTDGLNTVSLFERPEGEAKGAARRGMHGLAGPGRVMTWTAGGLAFTLVGDLPWEEMEKIAASLSAR
jgi:outer membrane lipoprotein-sorting protein